MLIDNTNRQMSYYKNIHVFELFAKRELINFYCQTACCLFVWLNETFLLHDKCAQIIQYPTRTNLSLKK